MNEYSIFLQNYKLRNVYRQKLAYIELYNKDNKNHSQFSYSEIITVKYLVYFLPRFFHACNINMTL